MKKKFTLKRFNNFVNENDNLERSIKGMDKFGITDYRRLPIPLETKLKEKGFINPEKHYVLDTTDESVYQKEIGDFLYEFYLNTTDNVGPLDDKVWVSFSISNTHLGMFMTGSIQRFEYEPLLTIAEDIEKIHNNTLEISKLESEEERRANLIDFFKTYKIGEDYVDPGKVNESNDNIDRSASGMRKFGMEPFNDLPKDLADLAKSYGYEKIDYNYWGNMGTDESLHYHNFEDVDASIVIDSVIYVEADENGNGKRDSKIGFLLDCEAWSFEIMRDKDDLKDIENIIKHRGFIYDEIHEFLTSDPYSFALPQEEKDKIQKSFVKETLKYAGVEVRDTDEI